MSILIESRPRPIPSVRRPEATVRAIASPEAQLRDARALLRHTMLALAGTVATVYAALAAGLAI